MVDQVKAQCQAVAVRFVADTRTDEFLNIGVVLFCAARQYAGAKFLTSWARISSAFPTADLTHLRRLRRLFERGCDEWVAGARQPALFREIESLDALLASVLAIDDATITFSKPISGLTANPEATLAELFRLYVGKDKDEGIVEGRDDEAVWGELVKLTTPDVIRALRHHKLRSSHYEQGFDRSWKNGTWNAAQPLSFDMRDPLSIRDKALLWSSKVYELRPAEHDTLIHFLVGLPGDTRPKVVRDAARDAFDILYETISSDNARVLHESQAGELAKKMEDDLQHAAG